MLFVEPGPIFLLLVVDTCEILTDWVTEPDCSVLTKEFWFLVAIIPLRRNRSGEFSVMCFVVVFPFFALL